ncbi:VOC family protein [Bacillus mesophilum]|uniref:VOC family protein n=1 Tax=Bacillus mesophilum TaxID=1071718 RepID=A0A7V7UT72_9BACI|nr:VOC family protein [Bacillus mesophilum]KAB2328897.1 VOC family protein [Bacillus mesophilum]
MKAKINIITLAVQNLEVSISFYKDGLGFPKEGLVQDADHVVFSMEDDSSLVLYLRSALEDFTAAGTAARTNDVILSCAVEKKEEVDSILKTAIKYGGTLMPDQPKDYDWGYSGYFKDPDGHIWEAVYFHQGS